MEITAGEKPFVWYYKDINPIPSYIDKSLNLVLLGDAAHPMLPWTGLGANTAFEDASALVKIIHQPDKYGSTSSSLEEGDVSKHSFMDRFDVYDTARRQKCEIIQGLARTSKPKTGVISFWILKVISWLFPTFVVNMYDNTTIAMCYDADPLDSVAVKAIITNNGKNSNNR